MPSDSCDCRPGMDGGGVYHQLDCRSRRPKEQPRSVPDSFDSTLAAMSEARSIALGVWLADHQDECGCEEPDSAFCGYPVPFEHTQAEMDALTGKEPTS